MCIGHTWIWYSVLTNHVCILHVCTWTYRLALKLTGALHQLWTSIPGSATHATHATELEETYKPSFESERNRRSKAYSARDRPGAIGMQQTADFRGLDFWMNIISKISINSKEIIESCFQCCQVYHVFHFLTGSDKTPGGQTLSGGATYAVASRILESARSKSRGPVANEEIKTVNVLPVNIVSPFVALRKGNGEGKTSMGRTVASSPTHLISKLWGRPWRCLDCCDSFRLVCRANWPLQMAPNMKGNLRLIENMALESRDLSRSVVASYILRISYAPSLASDTCALMFIFQIIAKKYAHSHTALHETHNYSVWCLFLSFLCGDQTIRYTYSNGSMYEGQWKMEAWAQKLLDIWCLDACEPSCLRFKMAMG